MKMNPHKFSKKWRLFQSIILVLITQGCATLYSGRDLKEVPKNELQPKLVDISIRFSTITEKSNSQNFTVSYSECAARESIEYLRSLKVFSSITEVRFDFEYVSLKSKEDIEELYAKYQPKKESVYFVEVQNKVPYLPHGGGLGMWGGLISAVS